MLIMVAEHSAEQNYNQGNNPDPDHHSDNNLGYGQETLEYWIGPVSHGGEKICWIGEGYES